MERGEEGRFGRGRESPEQIPTARLQLVPANAVSSGGLRKWRDTKGSADQGFRRKEGVASARCGAQESCRSCAALRSGH